MKMEGMPVIGSMPIEVVTIECTGCGLLTNDLTDWEVDYNEEWEYYYYLCPKCQKE